MRRHTMTFGKRKKSVAAWNARLDTLVYPKLFENIVSELKTAGYDPPDVEKRLAICKSRYDRITDIRLDDLADRIKKLRKEKNEL